MAFTAEYQGEERGAFEVPLGEDAYCLKCSGRMRVWSRAQDGTARHFKHVEAMTGGSGSGHTISCSGGESDEHQKWKNFAAERLKEVFGDDASEVTVEKKLAAPHTDKGQRFADAAVMFEQRDEQFGSGLAVEVQHKNTDKDIEATSKDYIKQNVAVAWLDETDFHEEGCKLIELDFRFRAKEIPTPLYFRSEPCPWWLYLETHVEPRFEELRRDSEAVVNAKLPNEYFDEKAQGIWGRQDWEDLFRHPQAPKYRTQAAIPRHAVSQSSEVKLPKDLFSKITREIWRETPFSEMTEEHDYFEEVLNGVSKQIKATFLPHWDYTPSFHHLTANNAPRKCDQCGERATAYAHNQGFRCGECGPFPAELR